MKHILTLFTILMLTVMSSQAASLAEQADSAYNNEDYRLSLRLYNQAMNADGISPQIYYNMGNAYYRINNLGRAVLCYQRALNLDPSMRDARINLEFVKTKILDKPEDDSSFLGNLHDHIAAWTTPDVWAWIAFVFFALLLGGISMYIFSSNVTVRKVGFFGSFMILVLLIYTSVIAYQTSRAFYHSEYAVVIVPTANLRTVPGASNNDGDKVLPIHEGTLLQITDSLTLPGESSAPKWYDVKVNNSTRAWVNAADVERI